MTAPKEDGIYVNGVRNTTYRGSLHRHIGELDRFVPPLAVAPDAVVEVWRSGRLVGRYVSAIDMRGRWWAKDPTEFLMDRRVKS